MIAVIAIGVYYAIDGLKSGDRLVAITHAHGLIAFELTRGIFVEPDVQSFVLKHPLLIHLGNYAYLLEHWPLIAPSAVWLFLSRRDAYRHYRSAFLLAASIAFVVFALYPVAPPRLAAAGFTDTAKQFNGGLLRFLQPSQLLDSYAALPSLHLAWNIIVSVALIDQIRTPRLRYLPALLPVGMTLAIIATGNHYVLDAIAGAAL
ncbi:MAG TPA: phosphatase PAP2 family protein, partial [Dehalococcoidia bacterium]|nr:phosphatase PAP2 family protein [Dehalococcoidia bacterium]